ncbi:MAG: hypothetical protein P8K68_06930 [Algibacter sp.]|uniref:hypothetical protein n=1 Tax=Algibacter sp. TaxID=1872428 RepID=UPI00262087A3|nr:hypothetical protein [Algibacter sp.]MDG1729918.1 hypothetical protein [Algibacter sp.]MDG2178509.1 hypothetical protein [Algibacter sp.]
MVVYSFKELTKKQGQNDLNPTFSDKNYLIKRFYTSIDVSLLLPTYQIACYQNIGD